MAAETHTIPDTHSIGELIDHLRDQAERSSEGLATPVFLDMDGELRTLRIVEFTDDDESPGVWLTAGEA